MKDKDQYNHNEKTSVADSSLVFSASDEDSHCNSLSTTMTVKTSENDFISSKAKHRDVSSLPRNHDFVSPYCVNETIQQHYPHTSSNDRQSNEPGKDNHCCKHSSPSEDVTRNITVVPVLEGERLVHSRWPRPEHRLRNGYYLVSWVAFFVGLFLFVAVEIIISVYTASKVPNWENPLYYLEAAATDFLRAVETNSSNQDIVSIYLVDRLALFKRELIPVCRMQMFVNFASSGLVLVCIVLALWWRHHDSVKSRGKQHLLQLCVAGAGLQLSLAALQATTFLCFVSPSSLEEYETPVAAGNAAYEQLRKMEAYMYGCQFAVFFFMCYVVGSFVQRQRVIYHIFVRNPFLPLKTVNYFTPAPWHGLVAVVVMSSYTIKLACFECVSWTGLPIISGVLFLIAVYTTWLGYYVFHTTSAHQKFSDFAQNLRILIGSGVFALIAGLTYVLCPTLIYNALVFTVATRCFNNLIVLDMLICQVIQSRYIRPEGIHDGEMDTPIPSVPVESSDHGIDRREVEHNNV